MGSKGSKGTVPLLDHVEQRNRPLAQPLAQLAPVSKKSLASGLTMCYYRSRVGHESLAATIPREVSKVKEGIHPDYQQTTIKCACGEVIETGSTKKDIRIEICSKCHPFYTGKQKLVDTSGRVEKFNRKFGLEQ